MNNDQTIETRKWAIDTVLNSIHIGIAEKIITSGDIDAAIVIAQAKQLADFVLGNDIPQSANPSTVS